jgi:hypothetical protein
MGRTHSACAAIPVMTKLAALALIPLCASCVKRVIAQRR